jgi:hypothetical protein
MIAHAAIRTAVILIPRFYLAVTQQSLSPTTHGQQRESADRGEDERGRVG